MEYGLKFAAMSIIFNCSQLVLRSWGKTEHIAYAVQSIPPTISSSNPSDSRPNARISAQISCGLRNGCGL